MPRSPKKYLVGDLLQDKDVKDSFVLVLGAIHDAHPARQYENRYEVFYLKYYALSERSEGLLDANYCLMTHAE